MNTTSNPNDADLWQRLVDSRDQGRHGEFARLMENFLAPGINRVPLLKQALRGRGREAAVSVLKRLSADELLPLFDELVWVASNSFGYLQAVRDAIVRLPREWVLQHIEPIAEPLIAKGTYEEYRRLLELYVLLDEDLTLRLAHRALEQDDPDIQEAGQDAMEWIKRK